MHDTPVSDYKITAVFKYLGIYNNIIEIKAIDILVL